MMLQLDQQPTLLVGGEELAVTEAGTMPTHDPATGRHVADVPIAGPPEVDRAVGAAARAAQEWGALSVRERAVHVRRLADAIRADLERFAQLDAFDSGNPVSAMRKDAGYGVEGLEYFAGIATELHGAVVPASADGLHMTWREPFGVVVRIIPFNHPFMFCAYQAAAPLMAGNAVIIKAPDQTPLSPLAFGRLCDEVLPPGLVTVLTGPGPVTGTALVEHPGIRRIAFTGRRETGLTILETAARTGNVKHVTLELGGKNPLIVYPDTSPEKAADIAVGSMNFDVSQGQSCGSTSRVFVHERDAAALVEAIAARLGGIVVGDPLDEATTMGPLVSAPQRDRVAGFIESGRRQGARVVAGGGVPEPVADSGGYYLEPTLFDQVTPEHDIAREEIFGPVIAVRTWTERDAMLEEVNATRYGLTANILTNDLELAIDTARRVDAGIVWVNGRGQHFITTPFGGHKDSGMGVEGSMASLESFTTVKSVHVLRDGGHR
jgi:acyl-CoA reductase-like NAD-dependent aldehyde dehydrogenase